MKRTLRRFQLGLALFLLLLLGLAGFGGILALLYIAFLGFQYIGMMGAGIVLGIIVLIYLMGIVVEEMDEDAKEWRG